VRAKNLFQTIGQAGDGEEQAVPPNEDPRAVDPNHQQNAPPPGRFRHRRVEPPPPLVTKAGRKKLQEATAAHHQKNTNNPKKEDGGAIPFLSLATTADRGEDNSISTPPTPKYHFSLLKLLLL
jgi:hypothetical protein